MASEVPVERVERRAPLEWRLWPPGEATRAIVAEKMVQHLITCSPPIEKPEAIEHAKRIEQEAFRTATETQQQNGDSARDTSMLQVRAYAKHASQLLLDTLKAHRSQGKTFIHYSTAVVFLKTISWLSSILGFRVQGRHECTIEDTFTFLVSEHLQSLQSTSRNFLLRSGCNILLARLV
jgi:hypothetical protein